jgi:CRP-like cAMP-binding protein
LLQLLATYGHVATVVATDLMIRSSERRCAAVLARLAGCRFARPEQNAPVDLAITQEMLAAAAGLSRNSTGTALRKLMSRGLVELGYGGMTVCAPAALRAFVESD